MRYGVWAAVALCAAAAGQARAQSGASTILGGASPANIQFKPVDTSNLVAPAMAAPQTRFNFSALLRRLSFNGSSSTRGVSPLPSPSTFPTYPNGKMVGAPPYQLGDPKAAKHPFQPVMPMIGGQPTGQ